MSSKDRNYAQEIIDNRKSINKPRDLIKIAKKMGYRLEKGYREGTRVYSQENVITNIPHKITSGVRKSVLEALASGESNFRKRTA